jgi:hypothetical protein
LSLMSKLLIIEHSFFKGLFASSTTCFRSLVCTVRLIKLAVTSSSGSLELSLPPSQLQLVHFLARADHCCVAVSSSMVFGASLLLCLAWGPGSLVVVGLSTHILKLRYHILLQNYSSPSQTQCDLQLFIRLFSGNHFVCSLPFCGVQPIFKRNSS